MGRVGRMGRMGRMVMGLRDNGTILGQWDSTPWPVKPPRTTHYALGFTGALRRLCGASFFCAVFRQKCPVPVLYYFCYMAFYKAKIVQAH